MGCGVGGGAWSWFMFEESQEADGLAFWSQAERVVWSTGQACSGGGGCVSDMVEGVCVGGERWG